MFFKTKKTNSKIRFQQSGFRQQLQSARGYKRTPPSSSGIKKIWPLALGVLLVAGVLYLIYVPNFLFIKNIKVNGISGPAQQQIVDLTKEYLKIKPLTAQGNWLFLSKNNLSAYISQRDQDIVSVGQIKKSFPSGLTVNVTARVTAFNVTLPLQQVLISNDGVVRQDISGTGTTTAALTVGLIPVIIDSASSTAVGVKLFPDSLVYWFTQLSSSTPKALGLNLDHFEMQNLQGQDITEYVTAGFKLMFNSTLNLAQNINQVQLLLSSLTDSQKKNLYYIDMRFEGKAFACYKNTACVQTPVIQDVAPTASTTP